MFKRSAIGLVLVTLLAFGHPTAAAEIEVNELLSAIKQEIANLQRSAKPPFVRIPWIEAEVSYVVKKEGSGGAKAYVITVEGKYATEAVQRAKYRLEFEKTPRVEAPGTIKNATLEGYDPDRKVIFLSDPNSWPSFALPMSVPGKFTVTDESGRPILIKNWGDLKGKKLDVFYEPGPQGSIQASRLIVVDR